MCIDTQYTHNRIEPWSNEWSLHTSCKCCRTKLVVDGALAPNVSSFVVEFVGRVFQPINWTRDYILQEILWESWTRLSYHLAQEQPILIPASESVKTCILQHCQTVYPRDDHRDFVNLVALMDDFEIYVTHRARRIAWFIYSMKNELLF